ncbi:MAG TPA: hypothetical protein PKE31_17545 [Pseudomonadota bacterium]|nr:hypothetical protein [Pseudomonadota bacterium]
MRSEERLLAHGGIHALDGAKPCRLSTMEPKSALEDLAWKNALVVRAREEGTAELMCGNAKIRLVIVKAARLDLVLVEDGVRVGQRFTVRAVPHDRDGRALEVGKWTELNWHSDGAVALDSDRSAGEFGICDTCFGVHSFRASAAGQATISADFSGATGSLRVTVQP